MGAVWFVRGDGGRGSEKRRNLSEVKTGNSRKTKKTEIHFLSIYIYA